MSDSDNGDFINRVLNEGDLFRQPSIAEAIRNIQNARVAAGVLPQTGRQIRTERMVNSVADMVVAAAIGNEEANTSNLSAYKNILNLIGSMGGSVEQQRTEIKEISRLLDTDNNGSVSNSEVSNAVNDNRIMNQINLINPLVAKYLRDPNMSVRKIQRAPVQNPQGSKHSMRNNVAMVRQGYAGFVDDVNTFNVDFDTQLK